MKIVGLTTGPISSCEQSNVGVTSWTNITSLPTPVLYDLAMVTLLGKAYVIGGRDGGNVVQTSVYMYDTKAPMSPGRSGHAGLALDNDRALVCGGYVSGAVVSTCAIYTASTDTWTTAPAMAQAARIHFNLVMSEGTWH